jgi:hypothetical protein
MEVQALGYVGIGATDLTDWTDFATNWPWHADGGARQCLPGVPYG